MTTYAFKVDDLVHRKDLPDRTLTITKILPGIDVLNPITYALVKVNDTVPYDSIVRLDYCEVHTPAQIAQTEVDGGGRLPPE